MTYALRTLRFFDLHSQGEKTKNYNFIIIIIIIISFLFQDSRNIPV